MLKNLVPKSPFLEFPDCAREEVERANDPSNSFILFGFGTDPHLEDSHA